MQQVFEWSPQRATRAMSVQFGVSYMGGDYEYVRIRRWPFSIGRNPANDLCLANSTHISRRHVRVFKEEDVYQLVVQGTNPTFLNGDPVAPDQPVTLHPGDRIELPDYLLEFRDTGQKQPVDSTVNVQVVSNSMIIIRRVASAIGSSSWTADSVHAWLSEVRGREINIQHHQVQLCLPGKIGQTELGQRLCLFDELISHLDPQALDIEIIDPRAPIFAD